MTTEIVTDQTAQMRLYNRQNRRLYLNASERKRFLETVQHQAPHIRAFCLTLLYTGCRLSEAREMTLHSVQAEERLISIRSLKKRNRHHVREIPVPGELVNVLQSMTALRRGACFLWQGIDGQPVDRATAYRWVKATMRAAGISGPQACPKGLRHAYGVHAIRSGIPLNMLQKWMGHASIKTTAIYANAVGEEEWELARRMWR